MVSCRRILGAAASLLALVTAAAPARANVAAPIADPGRMGPRLAAGTPLIVREERLSFQCEEVSKRPVCKFEAHYRIENPSAEAAGGRAAFYGLHAEGIRVTVEGRPSSAPLSPDDIKALDAEVIAAESPPSGRPPAGDRALDPSDAPDAKAPDAPDAAEEKPPAEASVKYRLPWQKREDDLVRQGFDITVPPSGRAEVVVTGTIAPGMTIYSRGYTYTAAEARHLLLYAGNTDERVFELEYLVSPIKSWAEVHGMNVSVVYPKSWSLSGSFYGLSGEQPRWIERAEGDWKILSVAASSKVSKQALGDTLELRVVLPGDAVEHGGPFVGIGGVTNKNDARGFRMRFGYEIAAPYYLIESLTVDTDFKKRVVLSPNIEAAFGQVTIIPILPSLSIGAGVPVQIAPKPAVGARLLGSAQLWALGFVAAVDFFPSLSPDEGNVQVSLLGRISL